MPEKIKRVLLFPIALLIHVIALPINFVAWVVELVKRRRYDPEKAICPGCGFRGDKGTNGKTCRIAHTLTGGPEKAMNGHFCFRCGAPYFTGLFVPAEKWAMKEWPQDRFRKVTPMKVQAEERPTWPIAQ